MASASAEAFFDLHTQTNSMKKIYTATLAALGLALGVNAQSLNIKDAGDNQPMEHVQRTPDRSGQLNNDASRGTNTCSTVLEWALQRSFDGTNFSYFVRRLENDTNGYIQGWSTYFDVPAGGSVEVDAITFFARSARADSADVDVAVAIFNVDQDGNPTGNPLGGGIVTVGEYTGGTIDGFEQTATFNAVTLTDDFAIAVIPQATTSGDSIDVLSGFTGSGLNDFPTAYLLPDQNGNSQWFNGSLFQNNLGARILHVYPSITYDASNSINTSVTELCTADEAVTLNGDEPVWIANQYWSVEGYIASSSTYWAIDGTFGDNPTADSVHTFADPSVDYTIMRHDSITMLSDFSTCLVTETATIDGGAMATDESTGDLASGADKDEACDNGPGTTMIYNQAGVDVFYNTEFIECTPSYVAEGFYSDGDTWWEIGANGALANSGECGSDTANSITEIAANDVKIFPNPANATLSVKVDGFSGDETYSIIDLLGNTVVTNGRLGITSGTTDIDVSKFESGVYTLVLVGSSASINKTFTIVH